MKPAAKNESVFDWREHTYILVLCAITLLLALMLRAPGEGRETGVTLPWSDQPIPELCSSKRIFDKECPGCGLTRSFICLAKGDFARAWLLNPGGVLLFSIAAIQIPYRSWQLWRISQGSKSYRLPAGKWFVLVAALLLFAQWVLRSVGWI